MLADFLTKFTLSGQKFRHMAQQLTFDAKAENNNIKPTPKLTEQHRAAQEGTGSDSNASVSKTPNNSNAYTLRAPSQILSSNNTETQQRTMNESVKPNTTDKNSNDTNLQTHHNNNEKDVLMNDGRDKENKEP